MTSVGVMASSVSSTAMLVNNDPCDNFTFAPWKRADIWNNDGCKLRVPMWAENPLRERSGHPQTFLPYEHAPIKHCRR